MSKTGERIFQVVWPQSKWGGEATPLAPRVDTLNGQTIAELSIMFNCDKVYATLEKLLLEKYPGIKRFIPASEFRGVDLSKLGDTIKAKGGTLAITGCGCWGTCSPDRAREAVASEKAGIPCVDISCEGFTETAKLTCEGEGMFGVSIIGYPGHTAVDSDATIAQKTRDYVLPRAIEGWTRTVDASKLTSSESNPRDIVFTGNFDEVNNHYYAKKWDDGLPIVPPTIEAVNEFLKHTPLSPDTNLGLLKPSYRAATVWSVAVNGVMAGCRPEHMPVLVAIAQAFADPRWDIQDRGSTIGWEPMAILNGPVMRQLGFNYGVGMFRAGTRANISVSRFMALFLRNIAGFVAGASDKSAFGREQFPLVFVEDELNTAWESLHETLGFEKSANVVTLTGIQTMSKMVQPSASDPTIMLDKLAFLMKYELLQRGHVTALASKENHDLFILTPIIANLIAKKYTKAQAAAYLYEKSKVPARLWDERIWSEMGGNLSTIRVAYPEVFQNGTDPDRLVPVFSLPDQLVFVVGGDYLRNRAWIGGGVGHMGLMTPKEVQLPPNWNTLVPEVLS